MQYFKHTATGQVYGADTTTRPPISFYEGKAEFSKTSAPKPSAKHGQGDQGDQGDQTPKE